MTELSRNEVPAHPPFAAWRAQVATEIRNRLRSPSSLMALFVILAVAHRAIPPAEGRAVSLSWTLPDGRLQAPLYTAGALGISVAVIALLFFALAAFYLVAGSVRRDRERGIGLILAATPMSRASYLGAKWLAHAVTLTLLSWLAFPVGLFHFWRSGVGPFDAAQFFAPALLLAAPAAAFIAAAALLFDVTPGLSGRGGLVVWFLLGALPLLSLPAALSIDAAGPRGSGHLPVFDPLGLAAQVAIVQASLPPGASEVSSGYVIYDRPVERVAWPGLRFPPGLIRLRGLNLLWSLLPFCAAVLVFDRFDPARLRGRARAARTLEPEPRSAAVGPAPARSLAALAPVHPRPGLRAAVAAELQLLWLSASRLKWLLPPLALVAALLPAEAGRMASAAFLLLLIPLISEAACREDLAGTRPLVLAQPSVPASMVLWKLVTVAAFLLALSAPLALRCAARGGPQALAVPLGMLFLAAFAVGAGSLTGGGKLFSAGSLLLGYLALNGLGAADFSGLLSPSSGWGTRLAYLVAGAAWIGLALGRERWRQAEGSR